MTPTIRLNKHNIDAQHGTSTPAEQVSSSSGGTKAWPQIPGEHLLSS